MQAVIKDWQPKNRITTPLAGIPSYINSGIIKAVMKSGEKISVAQIDYQEFNEENFQYVIQPYWEIIDGLPASVFQGIPGIDMDLRLEKYYRVNYIPTFIAERTPSENREDVWELLESVGLDYYDRFEWLLRTTMRAANDNLIVERRRMSQVTEQFTAEILSSLQYGDKVIVDSLESIADTNAGYSDIIFKALTTGVDILNQRDEILVDINVRSSMVPIVVTQRIIMQRERMVHRKSGIEKAKKNEKYTGRKPIEVDEKVLRQVNEELKSGLINVEEAMRRAKIGSKSTFYRKIRALEGFRRNNSYDENEWIYIQSEDRTSRFVLGTRGNKTLVCCGVNPSFASPENLDPTMKNVDAIAKANGYDSYLMINLYPMRATKPDDMHKQMDEGIVKQNLENIEKILSSGNCDIWAAWGTIIKKRPYLKDCLQQIIKLADTYNCTWYSIGKKSKEGHPHHPLYLSRQSCMEEFDMQEYLAKIK